jgi:hypothetical protein
MILRTGDYRYRETHLKMVALSERLKTDDLSLSIEVAVLAKNLLDAGTRDPFSEGAVWLTLAPEDLRVN